MLLCCFVLVTNDNENVRCSGEPIIVSLILFSVFFFIQDLEKYAGPSAVQEWEKLLVGAYV